MRAGRLGRGYDADQTRDRPLLTRYGATVERIPLQAVTPEALARTVPDCTLAEARKIVAQIHRGEPVAASRVNPTPLTRTSWSIGCTNT